MYTTPMGDDTSGQPGAAGTATMATPSLSDVMNSPSVSTGAAMALTYHGYRRTGSIFWASVYGLLGYWKPVVMVPIALAQGYGEKKPCP